MICKSMVICFMIVMAISYGCVSERAGRDGSVKTIAKDLDTVWEIGFLPDKSIIYTQRNGVLGRIYEDKNIVIAQLNVTEISEAGLLGLAVDPFYKDNSQIYLYYTYESSGRPINRVSRFIMDNNSLYDEKILVDGIPSARFHNGGRIAFGPDDKLYVTTGDATVPSSAQDIGSLAGKILRMNKDGTVPDDNPFGNLVYSYGHRNSQGMAWHDGRMFASEHGPRRHDEINMITKGGNYGWPRTCEEQDKETIRPIKCYVDFTLAPADISFFQGRLYVAGLRGMQLREILLDDGSITEENVLMEGFGRLRALGVQEELHVGTSNRDGRGIPGPEDDRILKLYFD